MKKKLLAGLVIGLFLVSTGTALARKVKPPPVDYGDLINIETQARIDSDTVLQSNITTE